MINNTIEEAAHRLTKQPRLHRAADWPRTAPESASAGLYAWYVDDAGAKDLSRGTGLPVTEGLIYVGQTGATLWPSGKRRNSTLKARIGKNHIDGAVARSTLRRTLSACLEQTHRLQWIGPKEMSPESEHILSEWIRRHLSIAIYPTADRDGLLPLEEAVIAKIDPPLNLEGCAETPLRKWLSEIRALHPKKARHRSP